MVVTFACIESSSALSLTCEAASPHAACCLVESAESAGVHTYRIVTTIQACSLKITDMTICSLKVSFIGQLVIGSLCSIGGHSEDIMISFWCHRNECFRDVSFPVVRKLGCNDKPESWVKGAALNFVSHPSVRQVMQGSQ